MMGNVGEFLRSRMFWTPVIALVSTVIVWLLPQVGITVTPELQGAITLLLWVIASVIVGRDLLAATQQARR
ncbi:MAG: hypothetical protein CL610_13600 [Anaerolineaceae bacterium]|nr:hypothetical protein [Anaerolineaceae bacterium]